MLDIIVGSAIAALCFGAGWYLRDRVGVRQGEEPLTPRRKKTKTGVYRSTQALQITAAMKRAPREDA